MSCVLCEGLNNNEIRKFVFENHIHRTDTSEL